MTSYLKLFCAVLIIPFVISSCSDDDEGASIIGTWEEVSFVASGCTDPADNETFTCTTSCDRTVITETTATIDGDIFNYTLSGNQFTLSLTIGGVSISQTGTFVVTEDTLTISFPVDPDGCSTVSTLRRV